MKNSKKIFQYFISVLASLLFIYILGLIPAYIYIEWNYESLQYIKSRSDIEKRLWLFSSKEVSLEEVPEAWRPNRIYHYEKKLVRYHPLGFPNFGIYREIEFYVLYDKENCKEVVIPSFE